MTLILHPAGESDTMIRGLCVGPDPLGICWYQDEVSAVMELSTVISAGFDARFAFRSLQVEQAEVQ